MWLLLQIDLTKFHLFMAFFRRMFLLKLKNYPDCNMTIGKYAQLMTSFPYIPFSYFTPSSFKNCEIFDEDKIDRAGAE